MKKVVSLLLCAVMLIGLLPVSALAANTNELTLTADKTEATAGEEIKFTISVELTELSHSFGVILEFDRDIFEFGNGKFDRNFGYDDDDNEIALVKTVQTEVGQEGFAVSFNDKFYPSEYSGKVATFTLTVKEGANFTTAAVSGRGSMQPEGCVLNVNTVEITNSNPTVETTAPTEPEHVHTWVEHEAVAPTCTTEGNIAYKQCSECGEAWSLGENAMPLGRYGWVLGVAHNWVEHEAVVPTCTAEGNIAYKQCADCGEAWTLGENPVMLSKDGWILGVAHNWVEHEAVAPTCDMEGSVAYKQCADCGEAWTLGENPVMLSKDGWILAPVGHTWTDIAAVEPTCDTDGNIAYQQCSTCGAAQTAGENPMPLGRYQWILGATGHTWVDHEAVAPTCHADGNIAYQQCSVCGAAQTAGENPVPLAKFGWILAAEHTGLVHYDAVEATCDMDGHEAYDYCEDCQVFIYADPLKLTYQAGVIPATGHTWTDIAAVEPTCDTDGNIAYQQCSTCGAAQTAGENPMPLGKFGWVLIATGHTWVDYAAVAPTCHADGNIAYQQCSVCGAAQTAGENPMPLGKFGWVLAAEHTGLVHYDAVEVTCDTDGHYAFDHCEDCEVFIYEDPLMLTYQAGVIPATGHKWVEYAAVEPTCLDAGNIAYKQCSNCGAAYTLGENPVALGKDRWVLAPVEHTIKHVAAKAATTEAEGNVEYWFCEDCGFAWLDEALTKNTNLLSVKTPKLEAEKEETKPVEKPEQKPEADNDKTGDATPVVALIVMAVLAMFGLALVMVNKKKFSV